MQFFAAGNAAVTATRKLDTDYYVNEVDRLTEEIDALRQQLRHTQRLASVGTMTSMVCHEFNNLLTPIISYAQLAQQDPRLTPKAISRAVTSGTRAADICQAILGMARCEKCETTPVNLAILVHDTLTAMAREPWRDGIELTCNVPEDLTVNTRRVELQQVILNLVINARWAVLKRGQSPHIVISAEQSDESVFIDITDNGVGIAPADRQHIFKPFFTTRNGNGEGEDGNGLGLALCRDILSAMGGWITVESMPQLGTTFTIHLPASC